MTSVGLQQLLMYGKESSYKAEAIYQIQKIFTLTSGATYYLAIDNTACTAAGKKFGIFPTAYSSTAGLCLSTTYKSALTSAGTEIPSVKINENSVYTSNTKIYKGSTPTITTPPDNAREYTIGTKATNQSSGSGSQSPDINKSLITNLPIIIKLVNQETSDNIITVGIVWFEY
jgi:hypothetical protein